METISACPHHGFDTWMLVNHFYDGMSPSMKQLLETMCGGDFLCKNPDEAMDFLNYVAETSKGWDKPNPREANIFKPPVNQRGGMYALSEDMELKAKVSTLAGRLVELERKRVHEVQAVTESHAQVKNCFNCQSTDHPGEPCTNPHSEDAYVVGQNKLQTNAPYGNTYNPNWRSHPNLSWKPQPPVYVPLGAQQQHSTTTSQHQQAPTSSLLEQAILNLSKVVGNFVEEKKGINAQLNKKIENVESSLNKRIDGLESNLNRRINSLQASITRMGNQQQEAGWFPSQPLPYPRGVHELSYTSEPPSKMDEVKAVITLRSGKEVDQPMSKPVEEIRKGEELEP